jgi:hypothetical protein
MGSPAASTHALHAAIAPASALVDERRTLYRLAADLFAPATGLSDNLLDHPIVRYEIGRALAGRGELDPAVLRRVAELRVRDAGVALAADPQAADLLEAPLRIIAPPGTAPAPLTEADGERFEAAVAIVADGVRLFRRLAPEMADDLLAHVSMLAVLKSETSSVVSASSRYVPGIVLIDEPATPIEVAEALVHEGAHEKFFDLAITREFLDAHAEEVEYFENSWSHAQWPLEQTLAAWHAYSCLAQFAVFCGGERLGPQSLLPKAQERADEIGRWLLKHEHDLRADARWLLHALSGGTAVQSDVDVQAAEVGADVHFQVRPGMRYRRAGTGRVVMARAVQPPDIFWLDQDASWVVGQLGQGAAVPFSVVLAKATEEWAVDPDVAESRLRIALGSLVSTQIVGRAS